MDKSKKPKLDEDSATGVDFSVVEACHPKENKTAPSKSKDEQEFEEYWKNDAGLWGGELAPLAKKEATSAWLAARSNEYKCKTCEKIGCARQSLSCGGPLLMIADGGKPICVNCVKTIGGRFGRTEQEIKKWLGEKP